MEKHIKDGHLPTAEEFLNISNKLEYNARIYKGDVIELLVKFAKLHVQEALKTALEEIPYGGSDEIRYEDVVHILDCYNLDNIK